MLHTPQLSPSHPLLLSMFDNIFPEFQAWSWASVRSLVQDAELGSPPTLSCLLHRMTLGENISNLCFSTALSEKWRY